MLNVAIISDMHVGSTLAISPKKYKLPDGNMHVAGPAQKYILRRWVKNWDAVFPTGKTIIVINGDIVEGPSRGRSMEVWAPRIKDQADAAIQLLAPLAQKAEAVYLVRGTPFHVMEGGPVEDYIAKEIGAKTLKAYKRLRLIVEGVTFEFVHKGKKFGAYEWTWENSLRQHAKSTMTRHLLAGMKYPDILVHSHYHRYVDSGDVTMGTMDGTNHKIRAFITPSWKLIDEWTNHTDSPVSDLGLLRVAVDGDSYVMHPMVEHIDPAEEVIYA